jgi:hypothetical protein
MREKIYTLTHTDPEEEEKPAEMENEKPSYAIHTKKTA